MSNGPETPQTAQAATPAPANLLSRIVGVLFSPRQAFQGIVAAPRWLGMLLVIMVVAGGLTFAFLSTEKGRQATLERQVSAMESFGVTVSDETYARMEQGMAFARYTGSASQMVAVPIIYLIMAGILYAIFNAAMGGQATFKQVFTIVTHSGAVALVQQLFTMPINYFRGSLSSPTNVAGLFPMLPEKSFLTYLLGTIDIFIIWWLTVLAIGLAVLYRRRTQPVATTLFVIYAVIALVIAGVRSMMGGS
jgi:hypothetical protein